LRHRILDTGHRVHHLVMIGAPFYDTEGAAAGMQGFSLEVTANREGDSPSRRRVVRAATQC
jgi:hypothetical protein